MRCSQHEAGVLWPPTNNGTALQAERPHEPRGARSEKPRGRADTARKLRGRKRGGVGWEWSQEQHPGASRSPPPSRPPVAGPGSLRFAPRSETRGNRLLIAEVGGKGSGRVSPGQNGSVGSGGRLPRLLRSSSASGGRRAAPPPHPGGREAARRPGQPRAHAASGRPGRGLGGRRAEPGGERGAPGARRGHFASAYPPTRHPPSPPPFPSPRGFSGLKSDGDAELWSGICPLDGAGPDQGERLGAAVRGRPSQVPAAPGGAQRALPRSRDGAGSEPRVGTGGWRVS